jgi:hypothetical protein
MSVSFHQCWMHTHLPLCTTLTTRTRGRILETLNKSLLFRVSGKTRQRRALMLFYLSASPLLISCTSDPLPPFCLKIVWATQEQLMEYVFRSSKCNVELQMLEAQDKTRTSKATSDMLRHKWLHPVQQPGPTQRLSRFATSLRPHETHCWTIKREPWKYNGDCAYAHGFSILSNDLDVASFHKWHHVPLYVCMNWNPWVTRSRWLKALATWWGVTCGESLRDYNRWKLRKALNDN